IAFIAKQPRLYGPRECVTEEIISLIGRQLPLKVAKSKLVRLPTPRGTGPDVRFMSRSFLARGQTSLKHGIELVADYLGASSQEMYDTFNLGQRTHERGFYTLEMILDVLKSLGRSDEERLGLQESFGRMIAFDALIGAPDRHAQNWGVVENVSDPRAPRRFAPHFDTSRGLFVDHSDDRILTAERNLTKMELVERYARRSKPIFGCGGPATVNHFDLIEHAVSKLRPALRGPISQVILAFDPRDTATLLERRVGRIISPLRMSYILNLLNLRHQTLVQILQKTRA
ncbi:MAG: HipA domain-containing protein, partial [Thaumarchaeota archaeon]|nr:HipA domain-containing protein [Nitrososphaerota archaeon]